MEHSWPGSQDVHGVSPRNSPSSGVCSHHNALFAPHAVQITEHLIGDLLLGQHIWHDNLLGEVCACLAGEQQMGLCYGVSCFAQQQVLVLLVCSRHTMLCKSLPRYDRLPMLCTMLQVHCEGIFQTGNGQYTNK